MTGALVTDIRFTPCGMRDRRTGLLGFLSFTLGNLIHLDGMTVRRTRDGRLVLSFPVRHDRSGTQHPIVRPLHDGARRLIERDVFAALGMATEVAP